MRLFDLYISLATLGLVLYFIFDRPEVTAAIINESAAVGGGFIDTLEGRSNTYL